MIDEPGVHAVNESQAEDIAQARTRDGWRVFRLPAGIDSRQAFFDAVRATLPLDPPLKGNRSWDALSDSVWSGLDACAENGFVVVWPRYTRMRDAAPADFATATDVLAEVAASLADPEATAGAPKRLVILQAS